MVKTLSAFCVSALGKLVDIGLPRNNKDLQIQHYNPESGVTVINREEFTLEPKEITGIDMSGFQVKSN